MHCVYVCRVPAVNRLNAVWVMTVGRSASGQTAGRGRRIGGMVATGTTVRRRTGAHHFLSVVRARAPWGLDALFGVVFVLSSGFDRGGRAVWRGHGVSAGRGNRIRAGWLVVRRPAGSVEVRRVDHFRASKCIWLSERKTFERCWTVKLYRWTSETEALQPLRRFK